VTNVLIFDNGKSGSVLYALLESRHIIAYPTYEDIDNAKKEIEEKSKVKFNIIPLYQRASTDDPDTIYFTDSLQKLCNSDEGTIRKVLEKIDKKGAKFTSEIHWEFHPDPECPYRIQNKRLRELFSNHHEFSLLITTINKVAYNPLLLSANRIHVVLNQAFYKKNKERKNDFITHSHEITKPKGLNTAGLNENDSINGYYRIDDENLPFTWFKDNEDGTIQIPSTLEELFLNLTLAKRKRLVAEITIYSRDAYIDHSYLPAFKGIEYVDIDRPPTHPQFRYFPQFHMSSKKWKEMNLMDRLLMFREIDRLVRYVANQHEGKLVLLLNREMNDFLKFIKGYRSSRVDGLIKRYVAVIHDKEKLQFINAINVGRKKKIHSDVPFEDVIKTVIGDFYKNYLSVDPWTRFEYMTSDVAFYDWDFAPDVILMLNTNYQFYQAVQIVSDGRTLDYHSIKEGGITFTDIEIGKSVCQVYVKTILSLSTAPLSNTKFVYIADPVFTHWMRTSPSIFTSIDPFPVFLHS
jgi:hypothetical protein